MKAALNEEEQGVVDRAIAEAAQSGYLMELHQCFRNAQAVLVADHTHPLGSRKLRYHEGYAPSPQGAAPHAWLTINGKIVEVTWQQAVNYQEASSKFGYYGGDIVSFETVQSYFGKAKTHGKYGSVRRLKGIPREML